MRESVIERLLANKVKALGGLSYKFSSPSHAGVPDRVVIFKSRVVFVELKTETGKLSGIQIKTIRDMREQGADVRVLKGAGEVTAFIDEIQKWD